MGLWGWGLVGNMGEWEGVTGIDIYNKIDSILNKIYKKKSRIIWRFY